MPGSAGRGAQVDAVLQVEVLQRSVGDDGVTKFAGAVHEEVAVAQLGRQRRYRRVVG